jgi:prepilin-type N-terminal cleavage/methylation domain-containing protein
VILRKTFKIAEKGFTLLEVITILVIIGIIAAVAFSRVSSTANYGVIGELDKVKSHLRYAQGRAIRTDSPWGIRFDSSTTYWLFQDTDIPANRKTFAGEDTNQVTLSKLSITSAPLTITFTSKFGSPGAADITIATSGGNITVTANTGFVP